MIKVGILAYNGCYGSSVTGLIDVLQVANAHTLKQQGNDTPLFSWQIIANDDKPVVAQGNILLQPDISLDSADGYSVVYLPACFYPGAREFSHWLSLQSQSLEWLRTQWQQGAIISANCTGTFVLAETGLLDNRIGTTTWWLARQFRRRYPKVKVAAKEMITECDNLICAGAMTSYLYLAMRLVERYASPEIASLCAKVLLIDVSQTAQAPYQVLHTEIDSSDGLVNRAQYWLQTHMQKQIDMKQLAVYLGVSQRTLIRRFKDTLDITPLVYLQNLRVETAKQMLEKSTLPLAEVIEQVGYQDASSFSRLFQRRAGLTPSMYRRKFQSRK